MHVYMDVCGVCAYMCACVYVLNRLHKYIQPYGYPAKLGIRDSISCPLDFTVTSTVHINLFFKKIKLLIFPRW